MKSKDGSPKRFKNPTHADATHAAMPGRARVGTIPQRYIINDHRRIFLDTDNLRKWDTALYQRFPQAEKVPIYGLDPGPAGSWDARTTEIYGTVLIEKGKRSEEHTSELQSRFG